MPKGHPICPKADVTGAIGPPIGYPVDHPVNKIVIRRARSIDDPSYSAHPLAKSAKN